MTSKRFFRKKRTRQKKLDKKTHKSDIYFEAFANVMQDIIGGIYFKDGQPVIICEIEIINTFLKAVVVKYLGHDALRDKQNYMEVTVDSIEEFRETFMSKKNYEDRLKMIESLGFNETTE